VAEELNILRKAVFGSKTAQRAKNQTLQTGLSNAHYILRALFWQVFFMVALDHL